MTIHKRIKQRREELGLSMQALAELVGVSAWQTIQQWEKEGGTAPKRDRLNAVAKALKTTPEELLFGRENDAVRKNGKTKRTLLEGQEAAGISHDAMEIAKAFDRLTNPAQRAAVIAQLEAFGVLD